MPRLALRLSLRNPTVYPNATAMHADYQVPNDRWTDGDLFGGDQAAAQQSDVLWRLRNLPAPKVSLLVISTRTEEDYATTQQFLAAAQQVTEAHPEFRADSLYLDDGGHSFETWRRELPAALEWMSDHLKTPQDREPRQ